MKRNIYPMLVAALTFTVLCSSPVSATEGHKGKGMNQPAFADFDLNSDGTITQEEFTKARSERIAKRTKEGRKMKHLADAPSFNDIDTDNDGGISPAEFGAHQAERRASRKR